MKQAQWIRRVAALSVAATLLLAGCTRPRTPSESRARLDVATTGPFYRPDEGKKPLAEELKSTAQELRTRVVARVRPPRPPLPTLTPASGLADLMHYALLNNPKVESAFYEWKAAVETITTERSLPNPMLQLTTEIMKGVIAFTPMLMTDPAMNIPGPGKLGLKADAAYEGGMKKRALFENEMLATALAVKRAYYQLWTLQEQLRWTREALAVVDEIEKLSRERLIVGKATEQDALRAQMERDRLKTQLANLDDSRKPVVARLRSALGVGPEEPLADPAPKLTPTPPDFTERSLLDVAFTRNPRLKEMRSEVLQAIALFHLANKTTVPDYSFAFGTKVQSGPMAGPTAFMPSAGITLPIWRDKVAAEIARGRSELGAARAKLDAEELDVAMRFAEVAYMWREADRNAALFGDRLLPKAAASLKSARAGYVTGASSFLDLLEAEKTLLDVHLDHAMAMGQREIALAEMSLVVLGRWPEGVPAVLPPEESPAGKGEAPASPKKEK